MSLGMTVSCSPLDVVVDSAENCDNNEPLLSPDASTENEGIKSCIICSMSISLLVDSSDGIGLCANGFFAVLLLNAVDGCVRTYNDGFRDDKLDCRAVDVELVVIDSPSGYF